MVAALYQGDAYEGGEGLGTAVGAPRLRMLATEPGKGDPGTGACSYGRMSGGKDATHGRLESEQNCVCFSHYTQGTAVETDLQKEFAGDFGAGLAFDDAFRYPLSRNLLL